MATFIKFSEKDVTYGLYIFIYLPSYILNFCVSTLETTTGQFYLTSPFQFHQQKETLVFQGGEKSSSKRSDER